MSGEKSPAFRFYARDFAADTAHLSDAEVGMYLRLLIYEWMNGSIPAALEDVLVCLPAGSKKERVASWRVVERFFMVHPTEPGRLIQKRLEIERAKQVENRDRRSAAGKKGAAALHGNRMANAEQSHATAVRPHGLAFASALASAETTAPPSGARAHEDVLDDDELDIGNRPVAVGPALTFARWFVAAGIEAGAIPKHVALDGGALALQQSSIAESLVATYPTEELERRARRLFAWKTHATDPLIKRCTIAALAEFWDSLGRDKAASTPVAAAPKNRSIETAVDAGATW